jgi:hypothetical protein
MVTLPSIITGTIGRGFESCSPGMSGDSSVGRAIVLNRVTTSHRLFNLK